MSRFKKVEVSSLKDRSDIIDENECEVLKAIYGVAY